MRVGSSRASSPYRGPDTPGQPRLVRLADLSPATRARLADASRSRGARWLAREVEPGWLPVPGWLAATVAVGLAALSSQAFASWVPWLTALALTETCLLLTIVAFQGQLLALLALLAARAERRQAGLRPGVYLFARELVDARSDPLVLHATDDLTRVQRRGDRLELTFRGDHAHELTSPLPPDALVRLLDARRQLVGRAEAAGDQAALRRLDPFANERAAWASSGTSIRRDRPRLRRLARAAGWLAPAALLAASVVAARLGAIELAAAQGDVAQLIRFAHGDRWTGGWADRRWAPLALAPGREDLHTQYLRLGADPDAFGRRLRERLGDCSPASRETCLAAVRALCTQSRDDATTRQQVASWGDLDLPTRLDLAERCLAPGWRDLRPAPALLEPALARAIARRDETMIRHLAPLADGADRPADPLAQLRREATVDLQDRQTRTRFVLEQALAYVADNDADLELSASADALAHGQPSPALTRALLDALHRQPYGPALRLTARSSLLDWRPTASVVPAHPGQARQRVEVRRVHARLQLRLETGDAAGGAPAIDAVVWRLSLHDGSYEAPQCGHLWSIRRQAERERRLLDATGEPLPWDVDTETTQRLDPPLPWPRPDAPTDDDLQALLDRLL